MNKESIGELITSVILRQDDKYTKDSIVNAIMYILDNQAINLNESINKECISLLVDNALDVFCRNGEIRCWNGKYRTADVHGYF